MTSRSSHPVRVEFAAPHAIAAVRASMAVADVPRRFAEYLNQVYAASRDGGVQLDGQNVFVYHDGTDLDGASEIDFGVGVAAPFAPIGPVRYAALPTGEAAATTHWGDYSGLGEAHGAVIAWCREHGRALAGTRWEMYGHWSDDPASRRTDVYYLLRRGPAEQRARQGSSRE